MKKLFDIHAAGMYSLAEVWDLGGKRVEVRLGLNSSFCQLEVHYWAPGEGWVDLLDETWDPATVKGSWEDFQNFVRRQAIEKAVMVLDGD